MIWRLTSAPSEGEQSRKVRVVGVVGATDNDLMI